MLTITDYGDRYPRVEKPKVKLPDVVEKISIGYDRGRLTVHVNGKNLYAHDCIGSSINIELDRE